MIKLVKVFVSPITISMAMKLSEILQMRGGRPFSGTDLVKVLNFSEFEPLQNSRKIPVVCKFLSKDSAT